MNCDRPQEEEENLVISSYNFHFQQVVTYIFRIYARKNVSYNIYRYAYNKLPYQVVHA